MHSSGVTNVAIEDGVRNILDELNLHGEHFAETPRRVAAMLRGFNKPDTDLAALLKVGFEESTDSSMVTQTNIPFKGLCAHHLLPFWGEAAVGYLPTGRVVGLSKMTRLVEAAGEIAPSTQEHITSMIADVFQSTLQPAGTAVITEAVHGCMAVRGARAPRATTVVSAMRGFFKHAPQTKQEFMEVWSRAGGR